MPQADAVTGFGGYLVSSRDLEEYRAMLTLDDADLAGSVLDCPGGGASFTASACALGADAHAVDPVYAVPVDELEARLGTELERGRAWAAARADAHRWDLHGDPDALTRRRAASAAHFTAHRRAAPERYVAASLPHLPFAAASADLVVSSHLLFTYADRLDRAAHLAALLEMARVARREVRVYPLVDVAGRPLDELLAVLRRDLAARGVATEVRQVAHEFQRGARHLLAVDATGPTAEVGASI